jgi:hypothetical protein
VPIRLIINNDCSFTPEEADILIGAFEATLHDLKLVDREDPLTLLVAKHIIKLAKQGERDPVRLRRRTIQELSGKRDASEHRRMPLRELHKKVE